MAKAPSYQRYRRLAATARICEVWDCRLRQSERELVLEIIRVSPADVAELATRNWALLEEPMRARIFIGLRDLEQLGKEASYALGYSRRNG